MEYFGHYALGFALLRAGDAGAAEILDLHPNTLRSRMKKLGIERPRA